MIQLDPEVWAKRIMGSILIPLAVLVGAQAAQCYSVGKSQTSLLFYNLNFFWLQIRPGYSSCVKLHNQKNFRHLIIF